MLRIHRAGAAVLVCLALVLCASHAQSASSSELLTAIHQGDHKKLAYLLNRGANPNERLPDRSLPIAWAIERQDAEAVRLLLKHRARVDDTEAAVNAFRPLIVACLYPADSVLNQLLAVNIDANARGPEGIPALSLCAAHAPAAAVEALIKKGAHVGAVDQNGQTALMWAAAYANQKNFKLLLREGALVNQKSKGGFTPLMFAIKSGSKEMAGLALAGGGKVDAIAPDGTTLIQLAMYQHNYGFAEQLLQHPVDINSFDRNGRQLLHAAAVANQPALVSSLLDAGANINQLTRASKVAWRYESNFRAGAYEFPKLPPLLLAAQQGHSQLMELLAKNGAELSVRDSKGNNLVLVAAASSNADALDTALRLSGDPDITNLLGETPLHRVLSNQSDAAPEMLRILAKRNANIRIANQNGDTAADIAFAEHSKHRATFAGLFVKTRDSVQ